MNALHRHSKWCTSMIACNNQGDDDADDEGDNNREQDESSQGGWAGAAGREPVSERMSEHASACLLACLGVRLEQPCLDNLSRMYRHVANKLFWCVPLKGLGS